jgi:hypothetical protein
MNNYELLQKLFNDKLLINTEVGDYDKYCIKLTESSDYSVTIHNILKDAVAIKTDNFPDLGNFFNCSSDVGQCKRADFVIIADEKLIFIELCRSKKQKDEVVQQLKGAQCVIEYCRNISEKFYNYTSFLEGYTSYFVSIYNIGVNKKPNTTLSNEANKTPDKFLKISSPYNIQFKQLCRIKQSIKP